MRLVILDGKTLNPGDLNWDGLLEFGEYTLYQQTAPDEIYIRAHPADILLVNKVIIDEALISRLDKLKYVVVTATGFNNVDVEACQRANIPVSNVTNYGSSTVAQHVFALLLALTNRAQHHYQLVQKGKWHASQSFSFWDAPLVELSGKIMGIIGYGNIGKKVAAIAQGFDMEVLFYSSSQSGDSETSDQLEFGRFASLDELNTNADVISLNTHLHESNKEMINTSFLKRMKKSAYLINTARGGLINEQDLYHALVNCEIAGAGLDVLSVEPPPDDHQLLHLDNCIITPHNAWASVEARKRMMNIVEENIRSYLAGKPIHLVH